ncbi:hypothetical protein Ae717Ps2_6603c [Pseudonocardia sp. Ae717_Ps2]|nr:hypothetical protein Ae717Ps2_6603c [Pseudonocardia sp. Ae717_Ps2]
MSRRLAGIEPHIPRSAQREDLNGGNAIYDLTHSRNNGH